MKVSLQNQYISKTHLLVAFLFCLLIPISVNASVQGNNPKNPDDAVFQEPGGERMWRLDRSKRFKTPEKVEEYLSELNRGKYNDWRLPSKLELYDLFQIFALKRNNGVKMKLEMSYWLTDDNGKVRVGTWELGEGCGIERIFYPGKKGYVKAVRP